MVQRNKGLNFTIRYKGGGNFAAVDHPLVRVNELIADQPLSPVQQIPDLFAWYDAGQGVTLDGSKVSLWEDSSGNGHDLNFTGAGGDIHLTASSPFFNNQPVVKTLASILSGTFTDSWPTELTGGNLLQLTVAMASRDTHQISFDQAFLMNWVGGANDIKIRRPSGFSNIGWEAGNNIVTTTASAGVTDIRLGNYEGDGAGLAQFFWQGVKQGEIAGTVTAQVTTNIVLGFQTANAQTTFAEVAVYTRVLTQVERQKLYDHWGAKYSIILSGSD